MRRRTHICCRCCWHGAQHRSANKAAGKHAHRPCSPQNTHPSMQHDWQDSSAAAKDVQRAKAAGQHVCSLRDQSMKDPCITSARCMHLQAGQQATAYQQQITARACQRCGWHCSAVDPCKTAETRLPVPLNHRMNKDTSTIRTPSHIRNQQLAPPPAWRVSR